MSIYDDIPDPFPLNVDVKSRPASFELAIEPSQKVAVALLSAFWLAFIPVLILIPVFDASPDAPIPDGLLYACSLAAIAYVAIAGRFWLWPNIASSFRRVSVVIGENSIEAKVTGIFGGRSWSEPLANYQGIAIENRGTHVIGARKTPVSAIVILHRDSSRTVPIVIDEGSNVSERRAGRKAAQLSLPLIEGIASGAPGETYPAGTIVVAGWQATKVRMLNIGIACVTALFALLAIGQLAN